MKKLFVILTAFALLVCIRIYCFAEEDLYSGVYEQSGIKKTEDYLTDGAREFLREENIDTSDYNWINSLTAEGVFSHIWKFIKSGAKAPLKAGSAVMGIIIIAAAVRAFGNGEEADTAVKFAVTLAVCSAFIYSVFASVSSAVNAIKGCSAFMLAFIPAYMGIVSVSGAPATAVSSGVMMLASAEFVNATVAFFITSVMGAYLALSVGAAVSPLVSGTGIAETFKKAGIWIMSFCTTVFLGLLGAKNAVNSAADSLSVKTARFILGTCVPVAGNALSGAVNTVSSSLSLLRSSVGIYGVVAIVIMLLPVLAELLLWRLILNLLGGVCTLFSIDETSKLFKAVDGMLGFLTGAVILTAAMFTVSLAITLGAGKAV